MLPRQRRLDCVKALCNLYEAMDSEASHPDEKAYAIFKRSTERCLLRYTKVCKMALSDKFLQWNTVHKHHLACHMPEQFKYLCPLTLGKQWLASWLLLGAAASMGLLQIGRAHV